MTVEETRQDLKEHYREMLERLLTEAALKAYPQIDLEVAIEHIRPTLTKAFYEEVLPPDIRLFLQDTQGPVC